MFSVTVKTLDGGNYEFSVEDEVKVSEFKRKIEERLDIPISQQRLIFQGRILQDDSRLLDCGVKDKVIHLVPRPPPSTQSNEPQEPVPPTTTTSPAGIPWGGINIQQAIQDITTGIFSGLGEFGRNLRPTSSTGFEAGTPANRANAVAAREQVFNRLYRQANRLLQHATTQDSPDDSPPSEEGLSAPTNCMDEHAAAESETRDGPVQNPNSSVMDRNSDSVPRPGSPMAVDSSDNGQHMDSSSNEDTVRTSDNGSATDRPLSSLADMLNRYRRLWHASEPYFERWEAMLNNESRSVHPVERSSEKNGAADHVTVSTQNDRPPLTESDASDHGRMTGGDSERWQSRFFTQMSRMLHLHAHMLHLLSDFTVVRAPRPQSNSEPGTIVPDPSTVPTQSLPTTDSAGSASDATTHRVLSVPESDSHLVRARINVEPILSFERSPASRVSAGPTQIRARSTVPSDRRRSQSVADVNRHQVNESADRGFTESHQTTTTSFTTLRPAGAAIIHRVDIPVISMNMINLPVMNSAGQPFGPVHSGTSGQPPTISITSTTATAPSAEPNTATDPATSQTTPLTVRQVSAGQIQTIDPFLVCHSHHFELSHRSRLSTLQGSFAVPISLPTMPFMPTTQTEHVRSQPDGANSTANPPTSGPPTSNADTGQPPFVPSSLAQQMASFVSAAANAATSAVFVGGLETNPFNVLLSSPPIHFMVGPNRGPTGTPATAPSAQSLDGFTTAATSTTDANDSSVAFQAATHLARLFGRDNPFLSAVTVESAAPPARPDDFRVPRLRALQPTVPSWAESRPSDTGSILSDENRLLNVIFGALIETVWREISSLASMSPSVANDLPPAFHGDFDLPRREVGPRVSTGLLTDIFSAIRSVLRTRLPGHSPSDVVNALRFQLPSLLTHANSALGNEHMVDALADLVFDGCCTDDSTSAGCTEAGFITWMRRQATSTTSPVVDVRASLVHLFTTTLSDQFNSWNESTSNFEGDFFFLLYDGFQDFLCLTDLLVIRLATSLGLQQRPVEITSVGGCPARHRLLSYCCDFSHLLDRMSRYVDSLSGSNASVPFFEAVLSGIRTCVDAYTDEQSNHLANRTYRLRKHCVPLRPWPTPAMEVDLPNGASGDDVDMEDLPFLDASSELPGVGEPPDHSDSAPSGTRRISPLPDWTTTATVQSPQCTLNAHPDSVRLVFDHPEPEGWHAVLPAEWVGVVTNDVATMARMNRVVESGRERFSDAYISGMPAKRRKIMKDRSGSWAKPPDAFLADCLSDAIRGSGCLTTRTDDEPVPSGTDGNRATNADPELMETTGSLVLALRELVSEKLSNRLASDPDFDPDQFPLANEAFGRRKN